MSNERFDSLEKIDTGELLPFTEPSSDIVATQISLHNFSQDSPGFHMEDIMQGASSINNHSQNRPHLQFAEGTFYTPLDHLTQTPCLEDLDTQFQFEVDVPMDEKEKKLWYYDPRDKRLFVKGDQSLTAIISCRPMNSALFVRLMPVYTSLADVRKPVNRCLNHKDQCKSDQPEHLVHCRNEGARYMGDPMGETFIERLSVVIPLRKSQTPRPYQEMIKEEIVFSITCLNSCSGIQRRPTGIIFTLENENMQILGRTVMNFKACTSPKRDFDVDRKKKLGSSADEPSAKRPMIVKNTDGSVATLVKLENEHSSQESNGPVQSPSTEVIVPLCLPNKEFALKALTIVQDMLSGEAHRGNAPNKKYFKVVAKQIEDLSKN